MRRRERNVLVNEKLSVTAEVAEPRDMQNTEK